MAGREEKGLAVFISWPVTGNPSFILEDTTRLDPSGHRTLARKRPPKAWCQEQQLLATEALQTLWGPILEALLISENVHDWPAQQLLDYGNSILSSLRPGMVYVGGTAPGRGIPTFLNATSDGGQHMIITQNALADASYLQYVSFLYGDQMAQLTPAESKQGFNDYVADARQRLLHDTQGP